jgi:hypothetical protein
MRARSALSCRGITGWFDVVNPDTMSAQPLADHLVVQVALPGIERLH